MTHFTYDVETASGEEDYCPYCNKRIPLALMSDEHVIPACIGGTFVIRVCQTCNSRIGQTIDPLMTRQMNVRIMATETGCGLSSRDRVMAKARLLDGRVINVYLAIRFLDQTHYRFECRPITVQPNGSKWIPAEASNPRIPPGINILEQDQIDGYQIEAIDPPVNASPAVIKIVLGTLYRALGAAIIQRSDFNTLRASLSGTLPIGLLVTALPLGSVPTTAPIEAIYGTHLVWAECDENRTLTGGVSIFGRVNFEVRMQQFGIPFPGRCFQCRAFTLP